MKTHKKHLFLIAALCILLLTGINACTKDTGDTGENSSDAAVSAENNATADVAELLAAMNMYYFRDTRQAPDFELTSVKGEKISLKRYRGKVVLLSFWTTW